MAPPQQSRVTPLLRASARFIDGKLRQRDNNDPSGE